MTKLAHVLCVDDDEDILSIAKMSLEIVADLRVSCCNSGLEARYLASNIKPDIILLDVMMPIWDGLLTLKDLRKHHSLDTVPIVFMTARTDTRSLKEYFDSGISGVIKKPFDPIRLAEHVNTLWKKFHDLRSGRFSEMTANPEPLMADQNYAIAHAR